MIVVAGETLTYLKENQLRRSLLGIAIPSLGFIATFIARKHYPFLTGYLFIFTMNFTLVYIVLIISWKKGWFTKSIFVSFILLFTVSDYWCQRRMGLSNKRRLRTATNRD